MKPASILLLAALAGCVEDGPDSFTVPSGVGATGEEANVTEPFTLEVFVVAEHRRGEPLSDVGVVAYSKTTTLVSPLIERSAEEALASARTGADGRATLRLRPGQTVHVAVGGKDGWTDEVAGMVTLGPAGGMGGVTIPLYRDSLPIAVAAVLPQEAALASAQAATGGVAGVDVPLVFSGDPVVQRAYEERLAAIRLDLGWNNTPTAYADLFAAVSIGERLVEGEDEQQMALAAGNVERIAVDDVKEPGPVVAHAWTRRPAANQGGMPFTFAGEARFVNPLVSVG